MIVELRAVLLDNGGTITLRLRGRLHHIGLGRTHARTHVIVLIDGDTSESPTPPPANSYATSLSTPAATTNQPEEQPDEPKNEGSTVRDVSRDHMAPPAGFEPAHTV